MKLGFLEFVVIVLLGGALFLAVRDDLQERDKLTLATAASSSAQAGRAAETAASGKAQAACLQGASAGFRAGQLASRLAAPVARSATGVRPTISAAELAQEVQP